METPNIAPRWTVQQAIALIGAAPTNVAWFYIHAGSSYHPDRETLEQGRYAGAVKLAEAEEWARVNASYTWSVDPICDSRDFDCYAGKRRHALWQCAMYGADGAVIGSLHGIDFGPNGEPWGDSYKRIVEAELATEVA